MYVNMGYGAGHARARRWPGQGKAQARHGADQGPTAFSGKEDSPVQQAWSLSLRLLHFTGEGPEVLAELCDFVHI